MPGGCGMGAGAEPSSMRKPHVPQNRKLGGTSLPHEGQRRIPPAGGCGCGGANPGENPGDAGRRTHRLLRHRHRSGARTAGATAGIRTERAGRRHPGHAGTATHARAAHVRAAHVRATHVRARQPYHRDPRASAPTDHAEARPAALAATGPASSSSSSPRRHRRPSVPSAPPRNQGKTCSGPGSLCRNDCRRSSLAPLSDDFDAQ